MQNNNSNDTSWQKVSKWYNDIVGESGHYFHKQIILPKLLRILDLRLSDKILDLACGQGILARYISENIEYVGVDLAADFIDLATKHDRNPKHRYILNDISRPIITDEKFTKAVIILAIQNIENVGDVFRNAANLLEDNGQFVIVMNHPCFRIPQYTFWDIDPVKKIQNRAANAYMTNLKIPILANPGIGEESEKTWSFHMPISEYALLLKENGFVIEDIEEWVSDKFSTGGMAAVENRARKEFPMFMTIVCRKQNKIESYR